MYKFYICPHCGNIVTMAKDAGVPVMCCGQKMQELVAGTVEASLEKHIPVYNIDNNKVFVMVGEAEHPMVKEHYIEWIACYTKSGKVVKYLNPGDTAQVVFDYEKDATILSYCNKHGLWYVDVE